MTGLTRFLFAGAMAMAALCASAQAAVLSTTGQGTSVDAGYGLRSVPAVSQVKPGDVIVVGKRASATLTYSSGCSFSIQAGQVIRVAHEPPCARYSNGRSPQGQYGSFGNRHDTWHTTRHGVGNGHVESIGKVAGIAGLVGITFVIGKAAIDSSSDRIGRPASP
jgi:hypothetical protein